MKEDRVICKFQRPLFANCVDEMSSVLIYNEDRSFCVMQPFDEEDMEEIFPNDEVKTYWECEPDEDNWLVPVKQVKEQDW